MTIDWLAVGTAALIGFVGPFILEMILLGFAVPKRFYTLLRITVLILTAIPAWGFSSDIADFIRERSEPRIGSQIAPGKTPTGSGMWCLAQAGRLRSDGRRAWWRVVVHESTSTLESIRWSAVGSISWSVALIQDAPRGELTSAPSEGIREPRAPGGEGRPHRSARRQGAGPRRPAQQARPPEGERDRFFSNLKHFR
jgi:hypothetical protein